jgi:HD-GYP domain-containing protein (c-di-GMP phosphodiesterase class II)
MTEDRPYRAALDEAEARRELEACAGAQFDPDCVAALMRALDRRGGTAEIVALRPPSAEET